MTIFCEIALFLMIAPKITGFVIHDNTDLNLLKTVIYIIPYNRT